MSEQKRNLHPKEQLLCSDVEGFDSLAELALDMRSLWNHAPEHESKSIKLANSGILAMGPVATNEELERRHYRKWQFKKIHFTKAFSFENHLQVESTDALPLLLLRADGKVAFHTEEIPLEPLEGDVLLSYVPPPEK